MALFLARAAGPAGIELLDPAEDQGFGDIDGYTSEIQDAINQIAELEIMSGTSDDAFSPDGTVSRADMAVFLDAFVKAAPIGPGGLGGAAKYADVKPDDEPFDDVASVSFGAYGSIRRVYELGITTGTADSEGTKFAPDMLVTRGQMAAFITRALAHTNARPAGLSVQSDMEETDTGSDGGFTLQISVRDDSHMPVVDAVVDHFSASSGDAAFDDDGVCNDLATETTIDPASSSTRCEIDAGDEATDSDGNLEFDVDETDAYCPGNTKWIWAWTGDIGDSFDSDDTDAAMVGVSVTKAKASLKQSHDAAASTVPFGETVTITIQAVDGADGKGDPVAEADVEMTITTVETSGMTNERTSVQEHKTDASGRVELTFSYDDPDPDANDDNVMVVVTRAKITGLDAADADDPVSVATVTWSDDDAVATSLTLSQSVAYHLASDKGGGVRHTVTATLTDQYGDPISGVLVNFWSNANNADESAGELDASNNGLGGVKGEAAIGSVKSCTDPDSEDMTKCDTYDNVDDNFGGTDKTNRKGVARKSYNRDSDDDFTEMIGAIAVIGKRDGAATEPDGDDGGDEPDANDENDDIRADDDADTDGDQNMNHYWAEAAGDSSVVGDAVVVDTDANTVVIQETDGANWLAMYDSNDQFNAGATGDTGGVKMAIFEDNLEVDNTLVIDLASDPEPGVNSFTNNDLGVPDTVTCHD